MVVREWDRDFKLPRGEKEWKPEQCAEYRPRRRPLTKLKKRISSQDLIGWWTTLNPGGQWNESWRFDRDGSGTLALPNSLELSEFAFRWKLPSPNQVTLSLVDSGKSPGFVFFREGDGRVEMAHEVDQYGDERTLLKVKFGTRNIELRKLGDDYWERYKKRLRGIDWTAGKKEMKRRILKVLRRSGR